MRTEIIMILDDSGSMYELVNDTVGGFDAFVEEQKKVDGEAFLTLVRFNHEYFLEYQGISLNEVPKLRPKTEGMTALLDDIGRTMVLTKERRKGEQVDQVIFTIITDGEENSSKGFNLEQIKNLIADHEKNHGWTFVFLGSDIDAFAEAGHLGVSVNNTMQFAKSGTGMRKAFATYSNSTVSHRNSGVVGQSVGNYFNDVDSDDDVQVSDDKSK